MLLFQVLPLALNAAGVTARGVRGKVGFAKMTSAANIGSSPSLGSLGGGRGGDEGDEGDEGGAAAKAVGHGGGMHGSAFECGAGEAKARARFEGGGRPAVAHNADQ